MPLVSRDGARIVQQRGDRRDHKRALRLDQGGPRGTARRRPGVHDVRAGDDGERRLADERVADAGSQAVLSRNVLLPKSPMLKNIELI